MTTFIVIVLDFPGFTGLKKARVQRKSTQNRHSRLDSFGRQLRDSFRGQLALMKKDAGTSRRKSSDRLQGYPIFYAQVWFYQEIVNT